MGVFHPENQHTFQTCHLISKGNPVLGWVYCLIVRLGCRDNCLFEHTFQIRVQPPRGLLYMLGWGVALLRVLTVVIRHMENEKSHSPPAA